MAPDVRSIRTADLDTNRAGQAITRVGGFSQPAPVGEANSGGSAVS